MEVHTAHTETLPVHWHIGDYVLIWPKKPLKHKVKPNRSVPCGSLKPDLISSTKLKNSRARGRKQYTSSPWSRAWDDNHTKKFQRSSRSERNSSVSPDDCSITCTTIEVEKGRMLCWYLRKSRRRKKIVPGTIKWFARGNSRHGEDYLHEMAYFYWMKFGSTKFESNNWFLQSLTYQHMILKDYR